MGRDANLVGFSHLFACFFSIQLSDIFSWDLRSQSNAIFSMNFEVNLIERILLLFCDFETIFVNYWEFQMYCNSWLLIVSKQSFSKQSTIFMNSYDLCEWSFYFATFVLRTTHIKRLFHETYEWSNYSVLEAQKLSQLSVIMMAVIKFRRIPFQTLFLKLHMNYIYSVDEHNISDINFDFPIK